MKTVYDHISDNNRKTVLLLILFPLSLFVLTSIMVTIGFSLSNDYTWATSIINPYNDVLHRFNITINKSNIFILAGTIFVAQFFSIVILISFSWMIISVLIGDKIILTFAHAKFLQKSENPEIYRLVENVAIAAGLPTPKIYIINDESLNAFTTGSTPKLASIALTTGIIAKLNKLELEAVIAHEMAHIGNRDIRLNMLIISGLSIFGILGEFLRNFCYQVRSNDKKTNNLLFIVFFIMIALMIFNYIVSPLIRFAISRSREYAADATAALITRNPKALAQALLKISKDPRVEVLDRQPTISTACIADPKHTAFALNSFTATHPSIDSRVNRLVKMAGLSVE